MNPSEIEVFCEEKLPPTRVGSFKPNAVSSSIRYETGRLTCRLHNLESLTIARRLTQAAQQLSVLVLAKAARATANSWRQFRGLRVVAE